MDRFEIRHKAGWVGLYTWSRERAEAWIAAFDPKTYVDKSLKAEDFIIIDRWAAK